MRESVWCLSLLLTYLLNTVTSSSTISLQRSSFRFSRSLANPTVSTRSIFFTHSPLGGCLIPGPKLLCSWSVSKDSPRATVGEDNIT